MKLIFTLIFIALVAFCTFLTKPIYREHIEDDLLSKTNTILDEEGLKNIEAKVVRHELQFTHKDGSNPSIAINEITKAIQLSDKVWGVYLPKSPVEPTLRGATFVGVEEPEGILQLRGELPDEALRSKLVKAAKLIPGVSKVDDQLIVADDIANPAWKGHISELLSNIVVSAESGRVFANNEDLMISGLVNSDIARNELGSRAKNIPHGKAVFLNKLTVDPWNEPSLRLQRKGKKFILTGVLPDELVRQNTLNHAKTAAGDAELIDQTTLARRTRAPWWSKNSEIFLPKFFGQSVGPAFVSYSAGKMEAESTVSAPNIKNQLSRLSTSGIPNEVKRTLNIAVEEPKPIVTIDPETLPTPEPKPEPKPALLEEVQVDLKKLAVYFDTSSATVKTSEKSKVVKAAALIKKAGLTETKLTVCGYADLRGNADFNRKLSLKRANAVRDKLIKLGVPAESLMVEFFGEDTSEVASRDLWKSRRVEISFNKTSKATKPTNN